jgi:hypothetical protein
MCYTLYYAVTFYNSYTSDLERKQTSFFAHVYYSASFTGITISGKDSLTNQLAAKRRVFFRGQLSQLIKQIFMESRRSSTSS